MAKRLRMTWLLCLTFLLAVPVPAQESREDKTPRIQNTKVPVETIADKRAVTIRLAGVVRPKMIRKTGRASLKLEMPERPVSESFKKKMGAKEAAKRKREEAYSKAGKEARAANEIEPKASFDINLSGGVPPDNTVAVTRTGFIVAADNAQIGFFREDGTQLQSFSYPDFFETLDDSIGRGTADPRVIYDPEENRFVFFIQSGDSSSESVCLLAFSTSDDPREDWNVFSFNNIEEDRLWFDYPSLSVNWREVFVTGNLFSNQDDFAGNIVYMIHKDDGYAGRDGLDALIWRDIRIGFFPASGIVAVTPSRTEMYGPGHYMVSTSARGGSDVFLYHITNHIEEDPRLEKYTIDVRDYEQAGSAGQQGTNQRLDIGDCRVKSAYYQRGKVYFVFGKDDGHGFNGIAFYRITVSDLSVKSKFFHDNQHSDYSYPVIANRGDNESNSRAILVFQQSGRNTFPRIRMRVLKSTMSAVSSSTTLKKSASFSSVRRWGDYIAIQRKYGSPVAWASGHTAGADNKWRSHLIQIDLP